MSEDGETARQWEVKIVGLSGSLCESMLVQGGDDTAIHDFKQQLAKAFGNTMDQRIFVGGKLCRPKEKLADCFAAAGGTIVTLVRLPPDMRSCNTCGSRGLFGIAPKLLRRCAGCLDTLYCDNRCQSIDWPRHKAKCFLSGQKRTRTLTAGEIARLEDHNTRWSVQWQ